MPTFFSRLTLNKYVVLALLGGFALLLIEVRVEHNQVLVETWRGWIPLLYSGLMLVLIPLGLVFWQRGGRKVLLFGFGAAVAVGILGFWFHSDGKPVKALANVVAVWMRPPGDAHADKKHEDKKEDQKKGHDEDADEDTVKDSQAAEKQVPSEAKAAGKGEEHEGEEKDNPPPLLAPLSFIGLGLIGLLVCLSVFQPDAALAEKD